MNNDDMKKLDLFSRRAVLLGTMKISLVSILCGRLFYLQFIKFSEYKTLSENNRIRVSIVVPLRGRIYDRKDVILADNHQVYRLILDKEVNKSNYSSIKKIVELLHFPEEDIDVLVKKSKKSYINEVILYDNLNWEQLSKIEENLLELDGISIDIGYSRYYPNIIANSHIIGYIGNTTEAELVSDNTNHQDIKIGKNGIEKNFDSILRGKQGMKKYEVDALGNVIKELSIENSVAGESLSLSIDSEIQQAAYDIFADQEGAAVTIDIRTGEIITMISRPGFDSNLFVNGISNNDWSQIINNPNLPLTNKSISTLYPPGSTFKLVVYLAALNKGFNPDRIMFCSGEYSVGNRIFHCWKKHGHGSVNMYDAIMQSCNCYIFEVAREIGISAISKMATELGLGNKTNIELPREAVGTIPVQDWIKRMLNKSWQLGDTLNSSIGQGYIMTTPLQLALMTSRIASGKKITPTLIKNKNNQMDFDPINVEQDKLEILRKAMFMVANDPRGTAYNPINNHYFIAGKTGTSQVISKRHQDDDLSKSNVAKKFRNHGLFISYGPYDNPKFASCVVVEHAGSSSAAVKVANKLFQLYAKEM